MREVVPSSSEPGGILKFDKLAMGMAFEVALLTPDIDSKSEVATLTFGCEWHSRLICWS